MSDTNAGLGMVPCRPNCQCDYCQIERMKRELAAARLALANAQQDMERELAKSAMIQAAANGIERERNELRESCQRERASKERWKKAAGLLKTAAGRGDDGDLEEALAAYEAAKAGEGKS